MDELKQAVKSSIGWLEMANYTASPTDVNTARAGLCAVSDTLYFYNGSSWATVGSGTGSTTFVGLTDTPADFTSAANKFLRVNATSNAVEFDTLTGDVTIAADGATAIASGVIIDADVKSSAAIAHSKLAALASGKIMIGSAGNVATDITMSGDATLIADGTLTIGAKRVTAAKTALAVGNILGSTAASAGAAVAIDISDGKLAIGDGTDVVALVCKTDKGVLIGNGTTLVSRQISGNATITNAGAVSVSGLTMASQAQGTVLYCDGSDWVILAVGTSGEVLKTQGAGANPIWESVSVGKADALIDLCHIDSGGAGDYIIDATSIAVDRTLTLPDPSGNDEFVLKALAQALTNKTLTAPTITGGTASELTTLSVRDDGVAFDLTITSNDNTMNADKTLTFDCNNVNRTVSLSGDISLAGGFTTTGAWTQVGAHSIQVTTTGNTTVTFPTTGTLLTSASPAITTPTITGGIAKELTELSVRDTVAAFDLIFASTSTGIDADRTITIDCNNTAATIDLNGNVSFGGTFTTTGNWTQTGAHTVGLTTANNTTLTLPTTGTLGTLAGAETLTNKTLDGVLANVVTKAAADIPYTLTASDFCILATAAAGDETVTLPAAVADTVYAVKLVATGGGNLIIDTADAATIDGAATITLDSAAESVMLACDGTNWHVLSVYKFA